MKKNTWIWVAAGIAALLLLKPELLKGITDEATKALPFQEAP